MAVNWEIWCDSSKRVHVHTDDAAFTYKNSYFTCDTLFGTAVPADYEFAWTYSGGSYYWLLGYGGRWYRSVALADSGACAISLVQGEITYGYYATSPPLVYVAPSVVLSYAGGFPVYSVPFASVTFY